VASPSSSQIRFLFVGCAGSEMGTSDGRAILTLSAALGTCISKENRRFRLGVRKGSGCCSLVGCVGDCVRTSLSIFSSGQISLSAVVSKGTVDFLDQ
jgi:hypothetical protein